MKIQEKYIDGIVKSINLDIQRKDFLTYEEQDIWKNHLNDILDNIIQQENKQLKERIQELRADYGNKAQVERDLLKERIEKALEYISNRYDYEENVLTHTFDRDNIKELYEILKWLNTKVEIIEDKTKKIEKIPIGKNNHTHRLKRIEKKLNEIIDYINKGE